MRKTDGDFFNFDELCDDGFSDDDCNFDFDSGFNLDNFQDSKNDELTTYCQIFILENDLPDDTDPQSLRLRVWQSIGFIERIKLMFRGTRP